MNHFRSSQRDLDLKEEYRTLCAASSSGNIYTAALLPANSTKNRYCDVLAQDSTRVVLGDSQSTDYINANWVRTPVGQAIVCQAPTSQTLTDFWQMVWEQSIGTILCLTKVTEGTARREKTTRYWPTLKQPIKANAHFVTQLLAQWNLVGDSVRVRRLRLYNQHQQGHYHELYCVQYRTWPDHSTPQDLDEFLQLLNVVHRLWSLNPSKTLGVHCSAGIGRSGTFIAIYNALLVLRKDQKSSVNIAEIVASLRADRPGSVQTFEQYRFIYQAVSKAFDLNQPSPSTS